MRTITINQTELVDALVNRYYIGSLPQDHPYIVAFNPNEKNPIAEIHWGSVGYLGWAGYMPEYFLVQNGLNTYKWGDTSEIRKDFDIDEDDEISKEVWEEAKSIAWLWIFDNLLEEVELDEGEFRVKYV